MTENLLSILLKEAIEKKGLSERKTAEAIGVSPTTIGRVLRGESIDVDTLVAICDWMNINPSHVLDSRLSGNDSLVAALTAIVESDPRLATVFDEALEKLYNQEIGPDDLRELLRYAAYRLHLGNRS